MFAFGTYHYPFCNNSKLCLIYLSVGFLNDCLVHTCQIQGTEEGRSNDSLQGSASECEIPFSSLIATTSSSRKYSHRIMEAVLE